MVGERESGLMDYLFLRRNRFSLGSDCVGIVMYIGNY